MCVSESRFSGSRGLCSLGGNELTSCARSVRAGLGHLPPLPLNENTVLKQYIQNLPVRTSAGAETELFASVPSLFPLEIDLASPRPPPLPGGGAKTQEQCGRIRHLSRRQSLSLAKFDRRSTIWPIGGEQKWSHPSKRR